jgi:hypothetical protein
MEYIERFVGRRVQRSLARFCFRDPEVFKVNAVLVGFIHNNKTFVVCQETGVEKQLPVRLVCENSLFNLKRAFIGETIYFLMATGMCKKAGLKTLSGNGEIKKENVTMTIDQETAANLGIDVGPEEVSPRDPNKLTPEEILTKMAQLGELYKELKDEYVIFTMSGKDLKQRPRGSYKAEVYAVLANKKMLNEL